MNDEKIIQKMFEVGEKDVTAPKHRAMLRAALLREHARARRPYFTLQTLKTFITMRTALIPISTFAVVALIFVGTVGISHKSAEAQELVQRSIARAVKLTPEIRAQIEAQLKANMMQTLQEAYAAPDLRILTKEEYEKEAQFTIATTTGRLPNLTGDKPVAIAYTLSNNVQMDSKDVVFDTPAPGATYSAGAMVMGEAMNMPVKYLRYTDPEGRKVTLGLDENDVPTFRIEQLVEGDFQTGSNGTIMIQGKVLKNINSSASWVSDPTNVPSDQIVEIHGEAGAAEAGFQVSATPYTN